MAASSFVAIHWSVVDLTVMRKLINEKRVLFDCSNVLFPTVVPCAVIATEI